MKDIKQTLCIVGIALMALASGNLHATEALTCPDGWTAGPDADWKIFWDDALQEAKRTEKKLFVLVAGSDWCGYCIKLKEDVLLTPVFKEFAKKNLVLLYLDLPKKPLPDEQKLHNETICGMLGFGGSVPCAAVFDADSRRRGVIPGYFQTPGNYIARITEVMSQAGELPKDGVPPEIFTAGYSVVSRADANEKSALPLAGCNGGCCGGCNGKRSCMPPQNEQDVSNRFDFDADDDATWYYETFFSGGKRCARIVSGDDKNAGDLEIPMSLDGYPVRKVDSRAFYRCTGLTSVKIPSCVISIGKSAFSRCIGLKSVKIAKGVTSIGDYAFERCGALKSVVIPSSVTSFGYHAFADCPSVTTVYVSKGDASRVKAKLARSGLSLGKVRFVEVNCE